MKASLVDRLLVAQACACLWWDAAPMICGREAADPTSVRKHLSLFLFSTLITHVGRDE